jgi:DNA repair exonuclease SbcCD ATPase subunit
MARPDCWDLMTNEKLDVNDMFVEQLTHSAYFVQTLRIKPSFNTRLEKLLSIFEQNNFIGGEETTKRYPFETDDSEIKEVLNILQYVAADEKTREELDLENYYLKEMDWAFGEKERELEKTKKEKEEVKKDFEEQAKALEEKNKALEDQAKILEEKDKTLEEQGKTLEEQAKEIALLKQQLSITT